MPPADPSRPPEICLYAARWDPDGPYGSYTRGEAWVGTGYVRTVLQTRTGGTDAPRVQFGLVPNGITTVSLPNGATSVPVRNNIYALPLETAQAGALVIFTHDDGSRTTVRMGSE